MTSLSSWKETIKKGKEASKLLQDPSPICPYLIWPAFDPMHAEKSIGKNILILLIMESCFHYHPSVEKIFNCCICFSIKEKYGSFCLFTLQLLVI